MNQSFRRKDELTTGQAGLERSKKGQKYFELVKYCSRSNFHSVGGWGGGFHISFEFE